MSRGVGLASVGLSLLALTETGWADPHLRTLACVSVEAVARDSGQLLAIPEAQLRDPLLVRVKDQLPLLELEASCPNRLVLVVILESISTPQLRGFVRKVTLELSRVAIVLDTSQSVSAPVWRLEVFLHGPPDVARATVLERIDHLLEPLRGRLQAGWKPLREGLDKFGCGDRIRCA